MGWAQRPLDSSDAWGDLHAHRAQMRSFDLCQAFDDDAKRAQKFSCNLDGLFVDYSKNLLDDRAFKLLCDLALYIPQNIKSLFDGDAVNKSENRPALHMALRGGGNVDMPQVQNTLVRMREISDAWRNDESIKDVVHIGIGGSEIGTRLICEALKHRKSGDINVHFAANIDPNDLDQVLDGLNPKATAFIVVSKSFATPETLYCALRARGWSSDAPMVAVSANIDAAKNFGINAGDILQMPQWVGGRYSLWSAAGLALAVQNGFDEFEELLSGARAMDMHFLNSPIGENMPIILALLNVWYRNIWDRSAMAVLPYAHGLRSFPEYVQQIEMESGGKSVDVDGNFVQLRTSGVVFGGVGTNAQHAIGQRLHQGVGFVPTDFIVVADGSKALAANAIAQAQALMDGVDCGQAHKCCHGNRPSTTIVIPTLNAKYLGMLLAMYEHKVFAQGVLWNINSFDQWGVELGKTLAQGVLCALEGGDIGAFDQSTAALVNKVRGN